MLTLPPREFVREGVPIAAILLFWGALSWLTPNPDIAASVRDAGVVMAGLYAVRRGVALSSAAVPGETGDLGTVLYANVRVAIPAGVWFLAAAAVSVFAQYRSGYPVLPVPFASTLVRASAGAGLGVVALAAVAVAVSSFRDDLSTPETEAQADD